MTSGEAIQDLVEQMLRLVGGGDWPAIDQIDFRATESSDVSVYVHLADPELNGGLPLVAAFDVASAFREEFEMALYAAGIFHRDLWRGAAWR